MKLILSHRTMAYATHILSVRKKMLKCSCYRVVPRGHTPDVTPSEAEAMAAFIGIDERLCLVCTERSVRPYRGFYFARKLYAGLPRDLLVPLSRDTFGLRPELVFLQMASELSLIELIRFGYDLCGSYAPGHGKHETLYELAPLTCVKKIEEFLDRCGGVQGIAKARRALKFVKDGSASPAESNLAIRFQLPFSMGGYSAPPFELNGLFDKARNCRWPDLYWEKLKIDMEYNSDEFHIEITRDALRSNQLQAKDLRVLTVTKEIASNLCMLDNLAQDFYAMAGLRFRPTTKDYERKKRELHRVLVSGEWYKRAPEEAYLFPAEPER